MPEGACGRDACASVAAAGPLPTLPRKRGREKCWVAERNKSILRRDAHFAYDAGEFLHVRVEFLRKLFR